MILVLPFVLGAILIGVAVHFASILAMPALTTHDVYSRLSPAAPANTVVALSAAQIAALRLPFHDTAFETAVCRYNLREGVLRLRAPLPETMLLVTLINRGGAVYYSVTDRAAVKGAVEVLVGTDAQIQQIEDADQEDEGIGELRVRAPSPEGLALIRVFAPDGSFHPSAARIASEATCQIETL